MELLYEVNGQAGSGFHFLLLIQPRTNYLENRLFYPKK